MSELYHNRILELAAGIPNVGQLAGAEGEALKVSRVCGSTVHVALTLDAAGEVVLRLHRACGADAGCGGGGGDRHRR